MDTIGQKLKDSVLAKQRRVYDMEQKLKTMYGKPLTDNDLNFVISCLNELRQHQAKFAELINVIDEKF